MKIIQPSVTWLDEPRVSMLKRLEAVARTCYKSENKITETSCHKFIHSLAQIKKHTSILEFCDVTVRIICDRGVSHELVRHRIGSYAQESTRYCNYAQDKFGGEITVIEPFFWERESPCYCLWRQACSEAERQYINLLNTGCPPDEARSVLPNSLKTEINVKYNLQQWRYVLKLRTAPNAHKQMRQVMIPILRVFREMLPEIYEDIPYSPDYDSGPCSVVFPTESLIA
jgi:thymidylate synthase (FAD)